MNIRYNIRRNYGWLIIISGLLTVILTSLALVNHVLAQSNRPLPEPSANERIVNIYDRGEERVIITKARTVRQALKSAEIEINYGWDVVEPGLDTELVATKYNVNIFRARPVTIVDGESRKRITTAQQTPQLIAEAAEVKLYSEDEVEFTMAKDFLVDGVDTVMNIDRATPVFLKLFGKSSEIRTQAETVGDLLSERGIKITENDTLSLPKETAITPGLEVELWRDGVQTVTQEEEVEFEIEQIRDANQPLGHKEVKTAGEKGLRNVTYEIETKNGKEISRTEIASVTTKEPKKQVEIIGTKTKPISGTCGEWMAAAGITHPDAHFLIAKESGCNPRAVNPDSGACGIPQALPCSKMGPVNADGTSGVSPEDQLRWMNSYVHGRYGGWEGARSFWEGNNWY